MAMQLKNDAACDYITIYQSELQAMADFLVYGMIKRRAAIYTAFIVGQDVP